MDRIIIFLMVIAVAQGAAFGVGTLQIGDPKVEGNQVTIPVVLGGDVGGGVSALDFRLTYDPKILQPVSAVAGSSAANVDKRVMANMVAPGEYKVVMMGFNQTTCSSGEVVKVIMQRVGDSGTETGNLSLVGPTLSSADGALIDSEVLPGKGQQPAASPAIEDSPKGSAGKPEPAGAVNAGKPAESPARAPMPAPAGAGMTPTAVSGSEAAPESPPVALVPGPKGRNLTVELAKADRLRAGIPNPGSDAVSRERNLNQRPGDLEKGPGRAIAGPSEAPKDVALAKVMNGANTVEQDASRASGVSQPGPVTGTQAPGGSHRLFVVLGITCAVLLGGGGWLVARRKLLN